MNLPQSSRLRRSSLPRFCRRYRGLHREQLHRLEFGMGRHLLVEITCQTAEDPIVGFLSKLLARPVGRDRRFQVWVSIPLTR
jgi:hypothetical protein